MEVMVGSSLLTDLGIEDRPLGSPDTVFNLRFVVYDVPEKLILLPSIVDSAERDQTFPGVCRAGKTAFRRAPRFSCSQLTTRE